MRRIDKGTPPECLTSWIEKQRPLGYDINYDALRCKSELLRSLIAEQYCLCGYTGYRINLANSHIEHLKPQEECEAEITKAGNTFGSIPGDDLAYTNMIAAFTVEGKKPFGACAKAHHYDAEKFVSPLDADCYQRFIFDLEGGINARIEGDVGAVYTIELLVLRHPTLVDARRGFLDAFFPLELLSLEYLELVIQKMDVLIDGALPEFSFVIKSAAEDLLPDMA